MAFAQSSILLNLLFKLATYLNSEADNYNSVEITQVCPKLNENDKSILYYVENAENPFTPGQPRHLSDSDQTIALKTSRAYNENIQPVHVDENIQAFVYSSPIDGAAEVKCGEYKERKCKKDKDCGYKRKCCPTPCGNACFNAIEKVIKK